MAEARTIDAMSRPNPYPHLKPGDQVVLPPELGSAMGRIRWEDGSGRSWAVSVPFGEDGANGALVYVYKADVRPVEVVGSREYTAIDGGDRG